jgi:hypothetical protein
MNIRGGHRLRRSIDLPSEPLEPAHVVVELEGNHAERGSVRADLGDCSRGGATRYAGLGNDRLVGQALTGVTADDPEDFSGLRSQLVELVLLKRLLLRGAWDAWGSGAGRRPTQRRPAVPAMNPAGSRKSEGARLPAPATPLGGEMAR